MLKNTCATIALLAMNMVLANTAMAASCATSADATSLKTAVMQQELMVAALQCHEAAAYNRFVLAYRGELQSSDATLKAFFVRRGGEHGEAGYDTFKTKAANLSALEQARDGHAFCADAHALFGAAMQNHGTLASFVEGRSAATDIGNICVESRPAPVTASAEKPRTAVPVRVAQADVAVGGVPAHKDPAIPYHEAAPPAPVMVAKAEAPPPARVQPAGPSREDLREQELMREAHEDRQDEMRPAYANAGQDDLPPQQPRYYQIRNRSTDDRGYDQQQAYYNPPRSYGPPARWSWYDNN